MWKYKFIGIILIILSSIIIFSCRVFAQSSTPGTPSNVLVSYPACDGQNCSFAQAKCTWGSATGASTYKVVITEVDTNTVIQNQSVSSSTLSITFNVTSGRTYKCDVTALNSAGQAGATGSHSLLCQTDQIGSSPTPTKPPIVTATPRPPVAGNETIFISMASISAVIILFGAAMVFVL